jgi:8-amino-7-oxononanoate synthase
MLEFINEELEQLKKSGLYRKLRTIEKVNGSRITMGGKEYVNFCSNDYLGLAQHPKVKEKAIAIIKDFGFGAGASRLISGNTIIHEELEKRIAKFKGTEAALIFPTGYMANLGTITALVDENDTVIIDRLNHASIIDACKLSKAKLQVYPHKDMPALEKILARSEKYRRRLIITDAVFSMDGDISPVAEIAKLGKAYRAITMTDDAHATGVVEIEGKADIVMGTLSKAVGSLGGFIAGSAELIDYLRNKARSFIYSTALPPAACAASLAALEIMESEPELRQKLRENIRLIRQDAESAIIPIIIGDATETMRISQKLFEQGIFVSAIRPPTVAKGESRLRITVSALHSRVEVEQLSLLIKKITKDA